MISHELVRFFRASIDPLKSIEESMMKSLIGLAFAGLTALSSSATGETVPKHRIVLIHGAFSTSQAWNPVAQILEDHGFAVTRAELPLTSLEADVEAAKLALATGTGPAVLVGHSWGGVVMGEVGADSAVTSLVYVAAFAPDRGESLAALSKQGTPSEGSAAMRPDEKGRLFIDEEKFAEVFAADLPVEEAHSMAVAQRPLAYASLATPSEIAAWNDKPNHYVVSMADKVIKPDVQLFFADRMGAKVTKIDSSHVVHLSHPEKVANAIMRAAVVE
jgi:pimeloyl-ACP methyl ester carboxylesterase